MPLELSPRFAFRDGFLLAGIRRSHQSNTAGESISRQWIDFASFPAPPSRIGVERYGVMCGTHSGGFEFMTAVQVGSFDGLPPDAGRMRVAAQRYAIFQHPPSAPLSSTWTEIFGWLHGGPFRSAMKPDFELYQPAQDPTDSAVSPEIWVAVLPAT